MITIEKINEVSIRLMGDYSDEQEVKQHFTFKAENYQHHPKYKAGLWNGDITLLKGKKLPLGLLPRLLSFCDKAAIDLEVVENETHNIEDFNDVTKEEIADYIHLLDVALPRGEKPRDYQIDAVYEAIRNKRRTLLSPTSSGKSFIIYCIIRYILDENPHAKIILMVPTVSLVNQMFSDFQEYSAHNGFDTAKYTQKLYTGQDRELTKNILITTWQSLEKVAKDPNTTTKILRQYNAVICDEAHTSKGQVVQSLLEGCHTASYRIGTTGTLDSVKVHQLIIEGYLGPVYKVITTKELMDAGQVSELEIKTFVLKYPKEFCAAMKKFTYEQEFVALRDLEARNKFIVGVTMALSGCTLILVNNKETHAEVLYEMLQKKSSKPVYYISGDVSPEKREEIRQLAKVQDCILVATFATMSTGVNIPNIRNIVFGSMSKALIRILQSIGRGLRLDEGKVKMILIDIIDDIRHGKRENYSYQHGLERLMIYQKEQFSFTITEIPFDPY